MATCAKCIHYSDCLDSGRTRYLSHDIACNDVEERCKFFKNKADFVEVVRCNKCSHCEKMIDQFDNDWYFCTKTSDNAEVTAEHFCSYGERK